MLTKPVAFKSSCNAMIVCVQSWLIITVSGPNLELQKPQVKFSTIFKV